MNIRDKERKIKTISFEIYEDQEKKLDDYFLEALIYSRNGDGDYPFRYRNNKIRGMIDCFGSFKIRVRLNFHIQKADGFKKLFCYFVSIGQNHLLFRRSICA